MPTFLHCFYDKVKVGVGEIQYSFKLSSTKDCRSFISQLSIYLLIFWVSNYFVVTTPAHYLFNLFRQTRKLNEKDTRGKR